jgi:hypothetical protein
MKGERLAMARKAPVTVVEDDDEVEDVELAELEEVDEDEAPAKAKGKTAKAAAEPEIWGVRNLIALIKEKTGKEYNPREVRTLLRRLARDGRQIDRDVIAGNKSRYSWTGADDPEVRLILKSVKGGSIEAAKKAALDKLKTDKAARDAAAGKGKKAVATPTADEDEDEDED